jgi:hypothetical protein
MSHQDDINQRIFEKLDALSLVINDLRMEVVELRTEMRLRKECPAPGSCVDLAKTVKNHEEMMQQAKGGWKLIVGATISSGALGAAISHLIQKRG